MEITARRFGQVEEIARSHGIHYLVIGEQHPPFFLTRAMATVIRAARLLQYGRKTRPAIAVNHDSVPRYSPHGYWAFRS